MSTLPQGQRLEAPGQPSAWATSRGAALCVTQVTLAILWTGMLSRKQSGQGPIVSVTVREGQERQGMGPGPGDAGGGAIEKYRGQG